MLRDEGKRLVDRAEGFALSHSRELGGQYGGLILVGRLVVERLVAKVPGNLLQSIRSQVQTVLRLCSDGPFAVALG